MMDLDEQRLHELGDLVTPGAVRPLEEVRRRSAQLRRTRRRTQLVAGGAALAAVALVVQIMVGPGTGGGPRSVLGPSAEAGVQDCRGYAQALPRAEVSPRLRYLLPPVAEPLTLAMGQRIQMTCPRNLVQAVLLDLNADRSAARRAISIYGPGARWGTESPQPVPLRGRTGEFVPDASVGAGVLVLRWTEPDGSQWVITSSGLSRAEVVAAANGLRMSHGRVVPGSLPSGYGERILGAPGTAGPAYWWYARYGEDASAEHNVRPVTLETWQAGMPGEADAAMSPPGSARFVQVNGLRATYTPGEGANTLRWRTSEGVEFVLTGPLDLPHLTALATHVRQVPADDPRLTGVPDGR